MRRYRGKPTEKLMEYLAFYFGKPYTSDFVCDAGMWGIELTNAEEKKFTYVDPLGDEIVIDGLNISQITRRVLEIDELWMFDGGINENV